VTSKNQVSPVIRISQGERDASARATHLEAANGKFLLTTNERKQMSTKTNFKRIALVAVAALGLGVLSSVPVQAATSNVTFTLTDGTATTAVSDSTTAATVTVNGYVTAVGDTIVVGLVNKTAPATAGSFVARLMVIDTTTSATRIGAGKVAAVPGASLAFGDSNDSVTAGTVDGFSIVAASQATASYLGAKFGVFIDSSTGAVMPVSGTYVFSILTQVYSAGSLNAIQPAAQDVSIVVSKTTAESTTIDPSKSTAFLGAGASVATADAAVSVVATAANTVHATLSVKTYNASSIERNESVTVSIAGAGTLRFNSIGGSSLTIAGDGSTDIEVLADGRSGTGTISVSTPTKTFAAKTINFYSKSAKTITATVAAPLLRVGTNAKAVRGVAVDANGVAWTGAAYIVASSAADALIAGSTTPVLCAYTPADARHDCDVAGTSAGTAKFKIIDAATVAAATATSNEITVTVSNASATSVKIEFDKATYAPNERARIYVTPLDATGKAIQAGTYTDMFTSTGIAVNGAISYAGTTTTADSFTASTAGTARNFTTASIASSTSGARPGSAVFTVYMPSSGGTVTLTATGGSALPLASQVALTATATVTDSGAAALAAVTALATTVASLRTLIVTLTNLVLKIQKKVRA
jgi:hypothetical protein